LPTNVIALVKGSVNELKLVLPIPQFIALGEGSGNELNIRGRHKGPHSQSSNQATINNVLCSGLVYPHPHHTTPSVVNLPFQKQCWTQIKS